MNALRILLVDDEEDFTAVLAERMETRGLQADVCNTGSKALAMAGENTYDAVILDLAMPGMDGIETLKRLLARNPDLQVIILTGQATLEDGVEAIRSGAMEVFEKPPDIDQLIAKATEARKERERLTEERMEKMLSDILRRKAW